MNEINKSVFSLFDNIKNISTLSEKKKIKNILKDFTDCICELYGIDKNVEIQNVEISSISEFLIQLGIINNYIEISILKTLLGKEYNSFISIISAFLDLNVDVDESLKKYMDYYRRESVKNYLQDSNSPTIVDFFCGAGGMSLGFSQNGFKVLL